MAERLQEKPDLTAHPNIISTILSHTDQTTQARCLRVSEQFQDIAGDKVYEHIEFHGRDHHNEIPHKTRMQAVLAGVFAKGRRMDMERESSHSSQDQGGLRNFKLPLLAKVRVLTISGHYPTQCGPFEGIIGTLFPRLKVLRLVPSRAEKFRINGELCFCLPTCSLIAHLDPQHIVYRHIGPDGLLTPKDLEKPYNPSNLKMVTYVFAKEEQMCQNNLGLIKDLSTQHVNVPRVRICFSGDEKSKDGTMPPVERDFLDSWFTSTSRYSFLNRHMPSTHMPSTVVPDGMGRLVTAAIANRNTQYEICGGETLDSHLDVLDDNGGIDHPADDLPWAEKLKTEVLIKMKKDDAGYDEDNIALLSKEEWKATKEAKWETILYDSRR